jgi:hypothetical protein
VTVTPNIAKTTIISGVSKIGSKVTLLISSEA